MAATGIKNDYEGFEGGKKINEKTKKEQKIKKTNVRRGIVENKGINQSKSTEIKDNQNS